MINSSREQTLHRVEERLADVSRHFEEQQEAARRRFEELTQRLENFATILREAQAQHVQAISEIRPLLAAATNSVSHEALNQQLHAAQQQLHNHSFMRPSNSSTITSSGAWENFPAAANNIPMRPAGA
jgi:hypothetical protein